MTIIPSSYLPPISYFVAIARGECAIDLGEHYIKRSIRNRTRIMTAQGVMELSIPIQKANTPRQAMHSIRIDYSKRWQHQHWMAILSAYKSSPFFDHYAPYFEPLYKREFETLVEFNQELMKLVMKFLQLSQPQLSTSYIDSAGCDLDLRPKGAVEAQPSVEPYIQVFFDRHPHTPNLSIIDLLFCEGPNACSILMAK